MRELLRRIQYVLDRRRFDRELAADLEFHREMAARQGTVPLGNPLLLREQARDAWGWTWIDRLGQDLNYAARILRRSPGFTLSAVLMLAAGIGVNIAAFSYFDLMVLRPLPVRDPATLLQFEHSAPGNYSDSMPYAAVEFYARHATTLSAVLGVNLAGLELGGAGRQMGAQFVTPNYFAELGASASLGRLFDPVRDGAPGAEPVVVLSHSFWERQFGADPSIVGKSIRLNKRAAIVAGVASPLFSGLGLGAPDVWMPIGSRPLFMEGAGALTDFSDAAANVFVWGRLRDGATPQAAEEELRSLAAELHRQHPNDTWEKETFPSRAGAYALTIRHEMVPLLVMGAALCLLILAVACGNLGGLLLARGVARQREISIRVAVGAGRARVVRQMITESLVLAALGSAGGLALGYTVLRLMMTWSDAPAWLNPAPDWRVLVFAAAMGLASAVLFGLTPAFQAAWQRHRATFARKLLIGAQVAASCVLLIVAGLLVRALGSASSAYQGFDFRHVITIDPHFGALTPAQAHTHLDTLYGRLLAMPGVESVAMASNPPLGNRWTVVPARIGGRTLNIHVHHVDPPFFRTMQIPLVRGRNLSPGEPNAIVVSESLARRQWPSEDPVGKTFHIGDQPFTVAGVAGSARLVSPEDSDAVEVYQAAPPAMLSSMVVLVRTAGPPKKRMAAVAAAARSLDERLFPEVQLMETSFEGKVRIARYMALFASVLGMVALLLACSGIVGMVAYAVSQRTREIGIRMALGAKPAHVQAVLMMQLARPVVAGLLAGSGAAAVFSQITRRLLYGVSNLDPAAYLAAMAVFAIAVLAAALIPARRALRVDPMRALSYD